MNDVQFQLNQKLMFIKSYEPLDFTKNMGQYALEINYTNGDKDVFTTPPRSPFNERTNDKGDFSSEEEFFEVCKWLKASL